YVRTVRLVHHPRANSAGRGSKSAGRAGALQLPTLFAPLERAARVELQREGIAPRQCRILKSLDLRYAGQSYEISLPLTTHFAEAFHAAPTRLYGYADRSRPIEIINLRLAAIGRGDRPRQPAFTAAAAQPVTRQRVRVSGSWLTATAHAREALPVGAI